MNRIYKTRFNRRLGVWQAVPETARGGGKSRTRLVATTAVLGAALASTFPVQAQQWVGGSGDWFTGANWDTGAPPDSSLDAMIRNGSTVQVQTAGALARAVLVRRDSTLEVSGSGQLTSSFVGIGDPASRGALRITGGGRMRSTTSSSWYIEYGSLVVDGAGSLAETSSGGNVQVGSNGAGTATLSNGGVLRTGAGMVLLGIDPTDTGTLNIGDGAGAGIVDSGRVEAGDGAATVNFNHTDTNYFFTRDGTSTGSAVEIRGNVLVNASGGGTTTLSGNNGYSGGTSIGIGTTLRAGNGGTTGSLGTGAIANDGTLVINRSDRVTLDQDIGGTGRLVQAGTGTLVLTGTNTYSGTTRIENGTIEIGSDQALGSWDVTLAGGSLSTTATMSLANRVHFGAGTTGNVTAAEGTTLTLAGLVEFFPDAVATFGTSGVDSTVHILNVGLLSSSARWRVAGGTLSGSSDLLTAAANMRSVTVDGGATLALPGGSRVAELLGAGTVQTGNTSMSTFEIEEGNFAGTIEGAATLLKTGSNVLVLAGTNSYTGGTQVVAGTLQIGNGGGTGALGSGDVRIENDAFLDFYRLGTVTVADAISTTSTGHLRMRGGGTLVLSGGNSYTDTFIDAGTLQVGAGGTTGTLGTGTVTNNGRLDFNRDGTLVVANTITGTGGVRQLGPGMLELTGSNSYSGGTALMGGTLRLGHDNALGTGQLLIAGGTLASAAPRRITNDIVVAGDFNVFPDGTGAFVSALELDGDMNLGGANRTVTNTMNIRAGQSGQLNIGGSVSNGGLTFADAGFSAGSNLVFFRLDGGAANTYTGETVVGTNVSLALAKDAGVTAANGDVRVRDAGQLVLVHNEQIADSATVRFEGAARMQVGVGAGATETVAAISDDGAGTAEVAIDFNGSRLRVGAGNFSGRILDGATGVVGLEKTGTGRLVLSGDSSYSGDTLISGGTLQVGAGGTTGSLGSGNVINDGALAINRSDTVTFAGIVSGSGSLTQAGTGRLVLTGANTYTGGTFVNAGTLSVNGSIVGDTTVNNGGALGGTGTVGNVTVASGGALAPGNSIGTLSVNGNLTFAPGSIYRVEANSAGAADRVNTVGAGTITINGGTVAVQAGGAGYQRNTRYTILSSGGATTGRFANATSNLAFLTPTLVYEGNAVLLNLQSSDVLGYASAARTPNQKAVANYLQSFADAPSNAQAAALIQQIDNMTADQAAASFDSIAGSAHASASQVASALGRNFSATLAARSGFGTAGLGSALNDLSQVRYASLAPVHAPQGLDQGRGFWAQAQGAGGRLDSDGNAAGSRYSSSGFVLGYDQPVSGRWLAGAALGYSSSHWNSTGGDAASGRIESPQAGLYARYAGDTVRVRIDGTFAGHDFTTDRTVTIAGMGANANSRHKGSEWGLGGQVEMPLQAGAWELRPLAGVRYAHLREDGFSETGQGPANLTVAERTTQNTLLSAGMYFVRFFNQGKGGVELRAVASHLAGDNDAPVTASIAGQPGNFTASGVPLGRNALSLGATVSGEFARNVSAYLDANYEFRGSGQDGYRVTAGLHLGF